MVSAGRLTVADDAGMVDVDRRCEKLGHAAIAAVEADDRTDRGRGEETAEIVVRTHELGPDLFENRDDPFDRFVPGVDPCEQDGDAMSPRAEGGSMAGSELVEDLHALGDDAPDIGLAEPVLAELDLHRGDARAPRRSGSTRLREYVAVVDFDDVIRTTFTARTFTDQEVTDAEVAAILDIARFAPSGGNRQGWRVVVVRDPDRKRQIIEAGIPSVRRYLAESSVGHNPWNTIDRSPVSEAQVAAVGDEYLEWFRTLANAPVLLVVGVDLKLVASVDVVLDRIGLASGASIYPFVHNILLVARSRGLGGALTTFPSAGEPVVQELVGLPPHVAIAAVVPLGHPTSTLTKLNRHPVESFARSETWEGPPLTT